MKELPKYSWKTTYGDGLTFAILRERYFPEFPRSIFYTRRSISQEATGWIATTGNFAVRMKIFAMAGGVELRGGPAGSQWILRLTAGEYGEVPGCNYEYRYTHDGENEYCIVFESPDISLLVKGGVRNA